VQEAAGAVGQVEVPRRRQLKLSTSFYEMVE
jgi:hypothetical protein